MCAADGRLRLGWRLLGFMALAIAIFFALAFVLPPGVLTGSVAMLVAGVGAGWALLRADGRSPAALGFHAGASAPAEALKGLALGAGIGSAVVGVMAAVGSVSWSAQEGSPGAWLGRAVAALAFLALPAAAEEAVLRGYPLQALAEAWGPAWGLGITSVAFGALHFVNPGITALALVNVTMAGVLLGVLYLRTGSLWWASGAHLGWNWSHGYLADLPVSGLELLDAPLYEGVARGPAWIGGGSFGPEGSVAATVVLVGAAAACWWGRALHPSGAAIAARPLARIGGPTRGEPA